MANTLPPYLGDLQQDGSIIPFAVEPRDVTSAAAIAKLEAASGIAITRDALRARGVLIRSDKRSRFKEDPEFDERHPRAEVIARAGVGHDNIDKARAARRGIATVSTPGPSTEPVAQHALMLLLAAAKGVGGSMAALKAHIWAKKQPAAKPLNTKTMTLGIIGHGRTGEALHRMAEPHFRKIIFTDKRNVHGKVPIEDLVREADAISMHVDGNKPVLTAELLAQVKEGLVIANTSRGGVIDTEALLRAMQEKNVRVGADVFRTESETMFRDDPVLAELVDHPNFVGSCHVAASDDQTEELLGLEAAARVIEFAQHAIVNSENIPGHTLPRVSVEDDSEGNGNGQTRATFTRLALTHGSVSGILARVTGVIAEHHINIVALVNKDGQEFDGHRLAMTVADMERVSHETANRIRGAIEESVHPHKTRLLTYEN